MGIKESSSRVRKLDRRPSGKALRHASKKDGSLAALSTLRKVAARTRKTGKPVMVSLREIASKHPSGKIPVVIADNVRTSKGDFGSALLIELKGPQTASDAESLPGQDSILTGSDMADLDEVVRLVGASGRSSVYAMEASNRIFGVLPPGRIRGKRYPRWQFSVGLIGEPLRQLLDELAGVDSWAKYQFFVSTFPQLGHVTPVELLTGHTPEEANLTDETKALLKAPHDRRLTLVVKLARSFANPS